MFQSRPRPIGIESRIMLVRRRGRNLRAASLEETTASALSRRIRIRKRWTVT